MGRTKGARNVRAFDRRAIFQIRHTLAHNQGLVTASDSAKFSFHGYLAVSSEIIDPAKDNLGESVRRFLRKEAADYTDWHS